MYLISCPGYIVPNIVWHHNTKAWFPLFPQNTSPPSFNVIKIDRLFPSVVLKDGVCRDITPTAGGSIDRVGSPLLPSMNLAFTFIACGEKSVSIHYLHQGGFVFACISPSVCLFVCLSVYKITRKVLNGFA